MKTTLDLLREAREEIEQLKAEIAWLKGEDLLQTSSMGPLCRQLRLTGREAAHFAMLCRRDIVTKESLYVGVYGDRIDTAPDPKITDVFICKIRPKLARHGLKIETIWGVGYRLTPESKAKVTSMLREFDRPTALVELPKSVQGAAA